MPRRTGARLPTAPPASLALASSILIALAAFAPNGAAAKRSEQTAAPETAVVPAVTATAAAEAKAAAKAERVAEREARKAERSASSGETSPTVPISSAGPRGADAHQAARAVRRAEHEARKHGSSNAASPAVRTGASVQVAGGAKAGKTHTEIQREREREREQRRREREANGGRLKEGHKQREQREQREAEEEAGQEAETAIAGSGSARQALAAGGVSSIVGGSPTAQGPTVAAVAGVRTGRAAHSRHHAGARNGSAAAAASIAGGLGLASAVATAGGEGAGTPGPSSKGRDHAATKQSESPIVHTVTQIVGVIPTALWILIGLLGLVAAAFAVASRVIARRARRLDRQRKELLEDVGLLQAALLPELPARVGPVGTSAAYRPASGPGAGGDFYDVFALPEGLLGVIVGDVSGHGREALPHTTLLRYTLRAYMEAGLSPREALRAAAPPLERQLGGSFATVVLASYDPRARRLTYSCAGHPHPILTGLDTDEAIIAASAPPIGAGNATGSRQTTVFAPGAGTACFYTDGVIEARTGGELYGPRRFARALGALRGEHEAEHAGPPAAAELLDRVAAETDRRPDDMAACLLELSGEDEAPRILDEELVLDEREAAGKRARRFLEAAGVAEPELKASLDRARTIAAEHGSAVVKINLGGERPRVSVLQDNVAPLRARALARTQEVAL